MGQRRFQDREPSTIREHLTDVGGLLRNDGWKLLLGHINNPCWQGPVFPNRTAYNCPSLNCNEGCLFNVFNDPHEINDVASANPDIVAELKAEIKRQNASVFSPWRGVEDDLACKVAMGKNKGFWGPFLD